MTAPHIVDPAGLVGEVLADASPGPMRSRKGTYFPEWSRVSRMAPELDTIVENFRHRPLDAAEPFTFVAADALTVKVREIGPRG